MKSSTMWSIVVFASLMAIPAFAGNSLQFDEDTVQFAAFVSNWYVNNHREISEIQSDFLFVQIHRHGDRSPMSTYPNDPHINYKWPGGKGALSPKGSFQMYTLGKTLRRRYHRLFPSDDFYTAETMQVLSSPRERTLMSSQSFLAGFMPPSNDRNRLPILWQPIAIHSLPQDMDNVCIRNCVRHWARQQTNIQFFFCFHLQLILQETPCPKYDQTYSELMSNPSGELLKFHQENADLIAYLSEHTGMVSICLAYPLKCDLGIKRPYV